MWSNVSGSTLESGLNDCITMRPKHILELSINKIVDFREKWLYKVLEQNSL